MHHAYGKSLCTITLPDGKSGWWRKRDKRKNLVKWKK
jgi:hypothetical protein